jgi:hypothetical protein
MGPAFSRKYGVGTGADIYIPMIKRGVVDYAVGADWTPATGDVKISKDGGTAANIGTLPVAVTMGNGAMWHFVFADAELQCKTALITIVDSATKAVEDQMFIVETFGNTSAMFKFDFSSNPVARGVVTTGASTISITTSSITPTASATDQFKGRIVIFDLDTTTANLRGQATDITGSSNTGTLAVTALTDAPANGDTFGIY